MVGERATGIRQVQRASAADDVRGQLLALIEAGELPVGGKLPPEHELARSFGVSRTVVREGLGGLRSIGVIESRAGAGTFVRSRAPLVAAVRLGGMYRSEELYEVRTYHEVAGAGLAAQRRTKSQLQALKRLVEGHARAVTSGEWIGNDLSFHRTLAEATQNHLHIRFASELSELHLELSRTVASVSENQKAPVEEHSAIVDALALSDARAARAAMRAHLLAVRDRAAAIQI